MTVRLARRSMPRTIASTTVSSSTVLKAPVKSLTSSTAAGQQRWVDVGDHRRDRDEVPAAGLDVRGGGFQRAPHAVEVDLDDAVPVGGSGRADRLQGSEDAGGGDHDVDRAEVLGDVGEDLLLGVEVADVDGPSAGVALAAHPGGEGLDPVGGQIEQRDVGAVGAQRPGQAGAEAAACSGDRDGLAGQVEPHRASFRAMTTLPWLRPAWT
jgi:hypothetical protein